MKTDEHASNCRLIFHKTRSVKTNQQVSQCRLTNSHKEQQRGVKTNQQASQCRLTLHKEAAERCEDKPTRFTV